MGDLILAQAALAAIKEHRPAVELTWMIDERLRAIAEQVPGIEVVGIRKPRKPSDYLQVWRTLRRRRFDVLLAMQANLRTNLLYAGIRASRRIGFDRRRARDGHRFFVNETIERRDEHLLDGFMQFAHAVGVPAHTPVRWPAWDETPVQGWWRELGPTRRYVVIHTGASKPERCWPAYRYGELAAGFSSNPSLPVVLTGGTSPQERAAATAFLTECPRAQDLCGKTTLDQLRAVIRHAAVVVSPDTAAVHLARAENVPVVGLYAVARSALSGPYQALHYTLDAYTDAVRDIAKRDPQSVDWHFRVHHAEAMTLIKAPAVWQAIERALLDRAKTE